MDRTQKIIFGVSIAISVACGVMNCAGDYFERSKYLQMLMQISYTVTVLGLIEIWKSARKRNKSSDQNSANAD
jgi:hypothetical protein